MGPISSFVGIGNKIILTLTCGMRLVTTVSYSNGSFQRPTLFMNTDAVCFNFHKPTDNKNDKLI